MELVLNAKSKKLFALKTQHIQKVETILREEQAWMYVYVYVYVCIYSTNIIQILNANTVHIRTSS